MVLKIISLFYWETCAELFKKLLFRLPYSIFAVKQAAVCILHEMTIFMILEVAILQVIPEKQELFERDFEIASRYIAASDGYLSHQLVKCIEQDNKYILHVEWENIEAHEQGFRLSDGYQEWKKLLHHYYDPFPVVEHYNTVFSQEKPTC